MLKINVAPTMTVGQSEHVRAVVGAKLHIAAVDREAALETNDGARVQIGRDLMISTLVHMELRSDSSSDFEINAIAPDATQRINENDATVWEWSVTPKQEGVHGLTLIVSDLKEGSNERLRTKIYPVHIEVRVTAWQRMRDVAVAGSSVLSGLAGLIGAWLGLLRPLIQRRQPGGDPGAPTSRQPMAGAPLSAMAHRPAVAPAAHAPALIASAAVMPAEVAPAAVAMAAAHPAVVTPATVVPEASTSTDALLADVAVAASPPVAAVMPTASAPTANPSPAASPGKPSVG